VTFDNYDIDKNRSLLLLNRQKGASELHAPCFIPAQVMGGNESTSHWQQKYVAMWGAK